MAFRSCIGCKVVCDKKDLIRLVAKDGKVVVDRLKCCPGRGAYVHSRAACVRKCLDSRLLGYRLRSKGIEAGELKVLFADLQVSDSY